MNKIGQLKTLLLLLYICVASFSAAIITPALPQIGRAFHLGHGALEWVVSIFLIGYVIGQLIYGPLANRFGRIAALRIGLSINLIGILLCLFSVWFNRYDFLLLGRFVTALGGSAGLACTFVLIKELLDEDRAKQAMSLAIVLFSVAIGLSVTVGGFITQYGHWSDCFWVLLLHGAIMLYCLKYFPETLKASVPLRPALLFSAYVNVLKDKRLRTFSLGLGFLTCFSYGYSAIAPVVAQNILHLSAGQYGLYNLFNIVGMIASGFVCARLLKSMSPEKLFSIILGSLLLLFALLAYWYFYDRTSVGLFFTSTTIGYFLTAMLFSPASHLALETVEDKASGASMMSFINMASGVLGVVVVGYLPFNSALAYVVTLLGFWFLLVFLVAPLLLKTRSQG